MKKKTLLLIAGMALMVLLSQSSILMPPARAGFDCEIDRFNDFMNASSTYTTALQSWYFENPISCYAECESQCAQLPAGPQRDACMAGISTCISNCDSSRFDTFSDAGDAMVTAGNQTCTYNPDYCAEARYLKDQCISTYQLYMQNPVLDENSEIDGVWWSAILDEYWSCLAASGINACE